MKEYLSQKCELVEKRLAELIPIKDLPYKLLFESARYSLLAGGKRLRPILALATTDMMGGDSQKALTAACTLELIHTYSLIHDDLPCMDNDDYRRGKPSLHKAYPEGHAVLTGDYLLTYAFDILANDKNLGEQQRLDLVATLARSSGSEGMIGGQVMDIHAEGKQLDLNTLRQIHNHKTGALISASVEFGGIMANASPEQRKILKKFGQDIGLAFQIIDDVLDVTASVDKHGKPKASDQTNHKTTYVSILGLEGSQDLAHEITDKAIDSLSALQKDTKILSEIARSIVSRRK